MSIVIPLFAVFGISAPDCYKLKQDYTSVTYNPVSFIIRASL